MLGTNVNVKVIHGANLGPFLAYASNESLQRTGINPINCLAQIVKSEPHHGTIAGPKFVRSTNINPTAFLVLMSIETTEFSGDSEFSTYVNDGNRGRRRNLGTTKYLGASLRSDLILGSRRADSQDVHAHVIAAVPP